MITYKSKSVTNKISSFVNIEIQTDLKIPKMPKSDQNNDSFTKY